MKKDKIETAMKAPQLTKAEAVADSYFQFGGKTETVL